MTNGPALPPFSSSPEPQFGSGGAHVCGIHHHISGPYLNAYANEMAWREDNRREANGTQFQMMIAATMSHPVSRQWKGYWQR